MVKCIQFYDKLNWKWNWSSWQYICVCYWESEREREREKRIDEKINHLTISVQPTFSLRLIDYEQGS